MCEETKYLQYTKNRNFYGLNAYKRARVMAAWEAQFTGEDLGGAYEEDVQTYKKLQEIDEIYGSKLAEYFSCFHFLWYSNNVKEVLWAQDIRAGRRKDIFINYDRVTLSYLHFLHEDSDYSPPDPREFSSSKIKKRIRTNRYSEADYQQASSFRSNWEDLMINKIDEEKEKERGNWSGDQTLW